jgi:hypothetical protein
VDVRPPRAARLLAPLAPALILLALAAPAGAQQLRQAPTLDRPPPFHTLSARRAIAIARADPKVRAERRERGPMAAYAYLDGPLHWQVSFFRGGKERAQAIVDDPSGAVLESWTGWQVPWKMARGYSGQFGGKLNAPYVWLPLCLLFLLPFVDPRRPLRLLHLDLLALLAFGASHVFFNRGDISVSVPLVYPVMAYLLARMLWIGFGRGRHRPRRVFPVVPAAWVALAVLFLVGFRVALNVAESSVIDVGYSGAIGAHRIATGHGLYTGRFAPDSEHGDTYGPVNYLLYVPFERALGFDGEWDDLPAAHAAALAFDLLTLVGLFMLGRRMRAGPRGRELGVALAFAWTAYPYSTFALQSNSNDSAVAMLLVWALVGLSSAPARGALAGLAAAAKLAPAAVAPVLAVGRGGSRRSTAVALAAFAAVVAAAFAPFLPSGGVANVWDRTLGYQAGRESPFSIWGQHESLAPLHAAAVVAAAALVLVTPFLPRGRRSTAQVAALAAVALIAVQLTAQHWFYLYVVWFAPPVLVALLVPLSPEPEPEPARWRSRGRRRRPRSGPRSATDPRPRSRTGPASSSETARAPARA